MNLYCVKYVKFTNSNNIKMKGEMDGKINLYCIDLLHCKF